MKPNTPQSEDVIGEEFSRLLKEMKNNNNFWEAYNLKLNNENTIKKVALNIYSEHFLMASILEAFISKERLNFKELNKAIWSYVPKYFIWNIPVRMSHLTLIKMIRIGYIETDKYDENGLPIFQITELGIKTLQEQTLQSLAVNSFFNFQFHNFNNKSFIINILAIIVALLSLIVTIIALS